MKVRDVCTRAVRSCGPGTKLSEAGWAMWEGDCGILPVLDEAGALVGVITDRDICMSVSTKSRPAAEIEVREAMSTEVQTCRLGDDIGKALRTIRQAKVRRLPVVDARGKLCGIVSLNDIALATKAEAKATSSDLTYEDLALAMKAICAAHAAREVSSAGARAAASEGATT